MISLFSDLGCSQQTVDKCSMEAIVSAGIGVVTGNSGEGRRLIFTSCTVPNTVCVAVKFTNAKHSGQCFFVQMRISSFSWT